MEIDFKPVFVNAYATSDLGFALEMERKGLGELEAFLQSDETISSLSAYHDVALTPLIMCHGNVRSQNSNTNRSCYVEAS